MDSLRKKRGSRGERRGGGNSAPWLLINRSRPTLSLKHEGNLNEEDSPVERRGDAEKRSATLHDRNLKS